MLAERAKGCLEKHLSRAALSVRADQNIIQVTILIGARSNPKQSPNYRVNDNFHHREQTHSRVLNKHCDCFLFLSVRESQNKLTQLAF